MPEFSERDEQLLREAMLDISADASMDEDENCVVMPMEDFQKLVMANHGLAAAIEAECKAHKSTKRRLLIQTCISGALGLLAAWAVLR